MLLPLAYVLEDDDNWENEDIFKKLEFWYWVSIFTGRYRERQNEKCVQDVEKIYVWLEEGTSPYPENYQPNLLNDPNYNDLDTLLMKNEDFSTNENISKALLQYTLSKKPRDFCENGTVLNTRDVSKGCLILQKHHLIPLGSATTIKQSSIDIRSDKSHILNSPLNFSLISDKANMNEIPHSDYQLVDSQGNLRTDISSEWGGYLTESGGNVSCSDCTFSDHNPYLVSGSTYSRNRPKYFYRRT